MRRLAIFVDAGYLWAHTLYTVLRDKKVPRRDVLLNYESLRQQLLTTAQEEFSEASLLRVYWYDGPGDDGKAEEHKAIEELDDFKLRLGTRNIVGQQKGVDGLIIADIIGLAQNKAISDALIVSGDADLTPGVVAAQGLGLRVHLLTLSNKKSAAAYLRAEVDRKCNWAESIILEFASPAPKAATPAPSVATIPPQSPPTTTECTVTEAETVEPINLQIVAQQFYNSLSPEERSQLKPGVGIPKKIDLRLLAAGRKHIRSHLEENEKRQLRERLKQMAIAEGCPTVCVCAPPQSNQ